MVATIAFFCILPINLLILNLVMYINDLISPFKNEQLYSCMFIYKLVLFLLIAGQLLDISFGKYFVADVVRSRLVTFYPEKLSSQYPSHHQNVIGYRLPQ